MFVKTQAGHAVQSLTPGVTMVMQTSIYVEYSLGLDP
jgi:hypothetical protein